MDNELHTMTPQMAETKKFFEDYEAVYGHPFSEWQMHDDRKALIEIFEVLRDPQKKLAAIINKENAAELFDNDEF